MPPHFNEQPSFLRLGAWQEVDEQHQTGHGQPAYRAVFKTLRLVLPQANFDWPNLHIRFAHGAVKRGGAEIHNAFPARRPGHWLLLERARLEPDGEILRYIPDINMHFEMGGWEDQVPDVWYVEFVLLSQETDLSARLAEGRRRLAPLLTMFDLHFGSRLLGVLLAEELGEWHTDGYWSRSLNSELVGSESQLAAAAIEPEQLRAFGEGQISAYMSRDQPDKFRLQLACDWYWAAGRQADPVIEYLHLWFVIEALCMPDTTNIAPVRQRLAQVLGGTSQDWKQVVGRHFGLRSDLVHGDAARWVGRDTLDQLRLVVETLLAAELSCELPAARQMLCREAGLG